MWTSNPDANGEYGWVSDSSSPYGYETWGYKWDYPDGPAPRVLPAAPAVDAGYPELDIAPQAYFVASQVNSDGLFNGEMLYSVHDRGDPSWIYSPYGGMPIEIPEVSAHSSPTIARTTDRIQETKVFFGTLDGTLHAVGASQCGYDPQGSQYHVRHEEHLFFDDSCDEP